MLLLDKACTMCFSTQIKPLFHVVIGLPLECLEVYRNRLPNEKAVDIKVAMVQWSTESK
jgi:hypothetical protein